MTTPDLALNIASSSPLARLETARRLLSEVRSVDDVKAIHDFAEAARIYARQARLGLEAQNDAAEIRLRAERKLGALLARMDKHPGGNINRSQRATGSRDAPARLHDLGISKSQSSRWQAIAAVPEHVFDRHLADVREQGRRDGTTELTSAGAIQLARQFRQPSRALVPITVPDQTDCGDRFEVADAAALPWPSGNRVVECRPDAVTLAYLAGAMDADGHFSVHKSSKKGNRVLWNETYSPRIGLGQVTKVVPELLRKTFGGTIRIEQRSGRNRPLVRWLVTNKRAGRACADLLPYLRIKAEQARLLVDLSAYAGKDFRKAAYWYAQQRPTWTDERLLSTDEASALLGYANPESVYQAIHNGTLLAIPSRGNVRRPRIPAGLVGEILAQRTGPTTAVNRVRPPQLQQVRERILRRVRELNRVGVDELGAEDHAADLACETRSRAT
jgi:hypothetical protein